MSDAAYVARKLLPHYKNGLDYLTDTNQTTPPTEPIDDQDIVQDLLDVVWKYGAASSHPAKPNCVLYAKQIEGLAESITHRLNAAPAPAPDRESVDQCITDWVAWLHQEHGIIEIPQFRSELVTRFLALLDRTEGGDK